MNRVAAALAALLGLTTVGLILAAIWTAPALTSPARLVATAILTAFLTFAVAIGSVGG